MDLEQQFDEINLRSFQGQLPKIPVQWSPRMVKAAGIFYEPIIGRRSAHIKLSRPLLLERQLSWPVKVAGVICEDRASVVRRVLEHEMLHVYLWINKLPNGHTIQFQELALEKFGHTEMRHTLRHHRLDDAPPISAAQLSIGSRVRFPFREEFLRGVILSIRRNATVLAEDERKFYVPISLLRWEMETAE
jgi:hypothetical protein